MACFIVPAVEAAISTVATKVIRKNERTEKVSLNAEDGTKETVSATPFSKKLGWLNNMLWGGSALLAFEHVWHGEVVPWFPFLTAAADPEDAAEMLHEMSTVGVSMAALVTAVWGAMVGVSVLIEKRAQRNVPAEEK